MAMKIQEALTRTTWKDLTDEFKTAYGDDSPVYLFLSSIDDDISYMVSMDYRDLGTIIDDDVPEHLIARMAFLHMGSAFKRIFDVLTAEYNPFENFFTEGEFSKSGSIEDEKAGTESTTPTGKIEVSQKGQSSSESDGSFSVGQGSTYDTASTTPPTDTSSASDLYNLSRNINKNKVKNILGDGNGTNLPTTTTEYKDNYHVEKSFTNRKDTTSYRNYKEETDKSGNSGIFSKQDLAQREVKLRLKNRIVSIYVRMVVDTFSTGVWSE